METINDIQIIIKGLIAGFGFLVIGIGILIQMTMLFCLPFFVYRIRKESILTREELTKIRQYIVTAEDTIELTDVVK